MKRCEKTFILLSVDGENVNYNVLNPSLCEDGVLVLQKHWRKDFHVRHYFFSLVVVLVISVLINVCLILEQVVMEISNEASLDGTVVASEEDAFSLYNDYAFRLGFSVRKGKQKFKARSITKYLKQFYCYKQGKKCEKGKGERSYTKVDIRTDCKAMIEFRLNDESGWTIPGIIFLMKSFLNGGGTQIWEIFIALSRGSSRVGDSEKVNKKDIACSSIWRRNMLRKFLDLIFANELNMNAQECIEEGFRIMKNKIIAEVGPFYIDNLENESGSSNIKDLVGRRAKREHNCNQEKGKRKSALTHASRIKTAMQLSMNNEALGRVVNAPSSRFELSFGISNCSDVEPSSTLQIFINFM
ncbi:hypothetical protein M9H77_16926 [Catharanthus roseus]|uniref:Uncharacterized protein n=1 Tax=Catharanthus roseus TaxID=4058 RepID=A0ACC0B3J1_CATRO|nr:hypothetical protein M9H77_16926 [Catharanthus roseus]